MYKERRRGLFKVKEKVCLCLSEVIIHLEALNAYLFSHLCHQGLYFVFVFLFHFMVVGMHLDVFMNIFKLFSEAMEWMASVILYR